MPTVGGPRDIANQIKADALQGGVDVQQLRNIGQSLMKLQMDVSGFLPGLEGQLDDLAGGVLLAADELAQNTQSVDVDAGPGVTA